MAGVTAKAQIDQAVEKFVAKSRYTLQERMGLVRSTIEVETLPENEGPSYNLNKYGQVTTYALTEGVDMTQAQQITDTGMTITPAEFGAQVILTDMMLMTVKDRFFDVATRILRDSFDRQQDQTLCDDFDNYSIALGSAGTALTIGHVMAAHEAVKYNAPADGTAGRGGEPAPDPLTLMITPAQIHALNKTLTGGQGAADKTQITPETERAGAGGGKFTIPGLPGLTVVSNININKDTSDDAKGGLYSKMAQVLVELGSAASPERERDSSARWWEINYVGRWARGEYDDDWGREMLFDSARPSS